jgi:S-DNA-T family DNA segregation ATPase FtsK/SpoIIIE
MMSSISDILTASYSTSREADQSSKELKSFIGAESNYEVIRLALGRSLGLESHPEPSPDARGSVIKGLQLFGDEDSCNYLWIGLLGEVLRRRGEASLTLDALQKLIRDHWHRGVRLLVEDRDEAGDDFKRFLEILARKANLPEQPPPLFIVGDPDATDLSARELGEEERETLLKHLRVVGVTAEIRDTLAGPRINRYKLFLPKAIDRRVLENRLDELGFALGIGNTLSLSDAKEPKTCFLDQPRQKEDWQTVDINQFVRSVATFDLNAMQLPVSPGVTIDGKPMVFDLASAPHLLLGGTTGSGKSVCLNALLLSLLSYGDRRPLRFALIDPKQVEFAAWRDYRQIFGEVATDSAAATTLLEQLIEEMEKRYERFSEIGVRDLASARNKGERSEWIILAVDELADLVLQDKANEELLVRLAQKGRAAGIHLILATQRPEAKTFAGLLRTNCPARIALRVSRASESKIIMDEAGAERLQGAGDMIFRGGDGNSIRAHSYNIRIEDIAAQLSA